MRSAVTAVDPSCPLNQNTRRNITSVIHQAAHPSPPSHSFIGSITCCFSLFIVLLRLRPHGILALSLRRGLSPAARLKCVTLVQEGEHHPSGASICWHWDRQPGNPSPKKEEGKKILCCRESGQWLNLQKLCVSTFHRDRPDWQSPQRMLHKRSVLLE